MKIDINSAVQLIQIILAVGLIVSSSELISIKDEFKKGGILSTSLSRSYLLNSGNPVNKFFATVIIKRKKVQIILLVRLVSAIFLLFVPPLSIFTLAALSIIFICSLLFHFSVPLGKDGSDQMLFIVISGLLITQFSLKFDNFWLASVGLWFITLQCILAYFTAGVGKLFGFTWRSGNALTNVLSTQTFGNKNIDKIISMPIISKFFNWSVVGFEVLFPIVLFLSVPWSLLLIGLALLFHLGIAYIMGLNTFIWAFGATYPAVLFCSQMVSV